MVYAFIGTVDVGHLRDVGTGRGDRPAPFMGPLWCAECFEDRQAAPGAGS